LPDQSYNASATPDSLSFLNRNLPLIPLVERVREPSAASGLYPAHDSGGKYTHQGAQEVPLTATAGM